MRAQQRYCFAAVHLPVQPSDCLNVPPPLRPDRRPTVITVMPLPLRGAIHPAVGTDGASGGLTDYLAAGDDDRVAAGARTRDAYGAHNPRAIETVAAAATALCAMRGAVLPPRVCCGVREHQPRVAALANRKAISRHCRCCRRRCRIAPAQRRFRMRPRRKQRAAQSRWNVERHLA